MTTKLYYVDPDNKELTIISQREGYEDDVTTLPVSASLEFDDEEEEEPAAEDPEPKKKNKPQTRKAKGSEAVAGGGVKDESWRNQRRVTRKQREQVSELLRRGYNSQRISDEIDEDLDFTNEIIEKLRGEDMDSKVETKEGVSL